MYERLKLDELKHEYAKKQEALVLNLTLLKYAFDMVVHMLVTSCFVEEDQAVACITINEELVLYIRDIIMQDGQWSYEQVCANIMTRLTMLTFLKTTDVEKFKDMMSEQKDIENMMLVDATLRQSLLALKNMIYTA